MREILFRGKSLETGEWVYGYLFVHAKGTPYKEVYILEELDQRDFISDIWKVAVAVDPKTVGQFTGFTDKHGMKIFEGDIVKDSYGFMAGIVVFHHGYWSLFGANDFDEFLSNWCRPAWSKERGTYVKAEVIGNRCDNPELMEEI